jgi:cysteinyl-tRNA synthetase
MEDKKVKMYTCGPSIYQLPHIGNYRTFLYEDVLQRYLEYLGYEVERVLNLTDVEDKAIAEAEKKGITLKKLTKQNAKVFLKELRMLKAKIPTFIPRSSTSVDQAVNLIERLLEKGYAYWHDGNVYYDPLKFKGFGKLYGLDLSKWPKTKRRFHKDTYPGNRWNRGDFILWHGYKKGEKVYWKTKLGKGRPAWNVQDPAMATQHLGFKVDISCGGTDNIIRHHDYIIAIVEGVSGEQFARYWLHGAILYIDGKKMSKSRGNIVYARDLIKQSCKWNQLRFFLIYGHYRKRINFTWAKYRKTCERLQQFQNTVKNLISMQPAGKESSPQTKRLVVMLKTDFEKNMNDDLHVSDAFDALFKTVSKLATLKERGKFGAEDSRRTMGSLKEIDRVLQVIF